MEIQELKIGSRRSYLQIYSQIVDFCRKPQTKFRAMQASSTSFNSITNYLLELQKLGFLETIENGRKHVITEKGQEFLERYASLMELVFPKESRLLKLKCLPMREAKSAALNMNLGPVGSSPLTTKTNRTEQRARIEEQLIQLDRKYKGLAKPICL